ncbi:3956_t:CDS:2, partial [Dentiscutata heterogama]
IYPSYLKPSMKECYFYQHFESAIQFVFDQFDECKPLTVSETWSRISKNTSVANIRKRKAVNDYVTFTIGWDSYRSNWAHERVLKELGKKMKMSYYDRLEFNYCVESTNRTKVLFPDGSIL